MSFTPQKIRVSMAILDFSVGDSHLTENQLADNQRVTFFNNGHPPQKIRDVHPSPQEKEPCGTTRIARRHQPPWRSVGDVRRTSSHEATPMERQRNRVCPSGQLRSSGGREGFKAGILMPAARAAGVILSTRRARSRLRALLVEMGGVEPPSE